MAVIDIRKGDFTTTLNDCWYPQFLNANWRLLTPQEQQDAILWVNTYIFDAALLEPKLCMNVTVALRRFIPRHPHWNGTPLQPLWDRTGQDPDHAALIYGNLVCRVGVQRPELWWCYKDTVGDNRSSMTYVLQPSVVQPNVVQPHI